MTRNEQIIDAAKTAYGNSNCRAAEHFIAGVMWADRTMIDRVCEWLDSNLERYVFEGINGKPYISIVLCDDLRNAMNSDNH